MPERGYPAHNPPPLVDRGYTPPPQPPRGYADNPQIPADRGYAQAPQQYQYNPNPSAPDFGREQYDPRYENQNGWSGEEDGFHGSDGRAAHQQLAPQGDELDEDFFADDEDFDQDHYPGSEKRGRKKLILAALAGAIAVGGGGAYVYKMMKGGGGERATPIIRADGTPTRGLPSNPGGKRFPNGEKAIYDRLMPDGQQTQAAAFTPPPAPQSVAEAAAGTPANTLEDRIEEALKKAQRSGDAPPPAAASSSSGTDQPTVVRSESYRPDGSRVDTPRALITPNIVNVNSGQLPPPFGNAPTASLEATPQAAPFRTAAAPAAPFATATTPSHRSAPVHVAALQQPAEQPAAPPAAGGFYVSLKSSPDEKAIQRDLHALSEKYKSALGDVQLNVKIADLGAKGVTYRAVAGPLGTRQEAMELCQKIKGVGGGCFVTN